MHNVDEILLSSAYNKDLYNCATNLLYGVLPIRQHPFADTA